jgi:hypothetical protein
MIDFSKWVKISDGYENNYNNFIDFLKDNNYNLNKYYIHLDKYCKKKKIPMNNFFSIIHPSKWLDINIESTIYFLYIKNKWKNIIKKLYI